MAEGTWQRTAWQASVDETGQVGTVLIPDKNYCGCLDLAAGKCMETV